MSDAEAGRHSGQALGTAEVIAVAGRGDHVLILDRIREWGLVVMLAWAPLPFGSARPWAWSLLGVVALALLLLSVAVEAAAPRVARPLRQLVVPFGFGVVLVFWILLQSLPGGLFGLHHPLWDHVSELLGTRVVASISVDREASRIHLFRLLIYAAVFWTAWQVGQRRTGAALIVKAIAIIGVAYAAYGIVEYSSADPSILWFFKRYYAQDLTSTFVNRNSFATYAGLGFVCNLLLFTNALMTKVDTSSRVTTVLSTIEGLLWRGKWAVVGLGVVGSALLLSHSRGGAISSLCAVVAFAVAVAVAPSLRSRQQAVFAILLVIGAIALFLVSGEGLLVRLAETSVPDDGRNDLYSAMFRAIHDNLLAGSGLGSFSSIYPMYQERTFDGIMDFAHDDYLENALDLGIPGFLLLLALLTMLVGFCAIGIVKRRRDVVFACVAVSATVLVGLHALVDFSMQIPAVAVTYAAILGVGVAQSLSSRPSTRW